MKNKLHNLGNGFTAQRSYVQPSKWSIYRDNVFFGHTGSLAQARAVAESFQD